MDLVLLLAMISAAQVEILAAKLAVATVIKFVFSLVIAAETSMSSTARATEVRKCLRLIPFLLHVVTAVVLLFVQHSQTSLLD